MFGAIIGAVVASLSFAFADNANGIAVQKNSTYKVAVWAVLFSSVLFFVPMLLFFGHEIEKLNLVNVLLIFGTGILVALGYLSFLTGMNKGSVTLTGVIGGAYPAMTTLTALLFFGERLSLAQGFAIAIILIGIALSSLEGNARSLISGIRGSALVYALGAFFLWGVYFAVVRIPIERVGWFLPQYGSNIIALPLYLFIAWRMGEKAVLSRPKLPGLIALISVLQIVGGVAFNYAISKGDTSIVAPIAGSSPAVFVVLAYFIFKEKIKPIQIVGIVSVIVGIIGLSILSS
ncbi:MAG TPA: DMT family transporter [Verrucomicrobiae bacterium]|nr:DMT family transporter [Verrucomicrobiae bacterium]